MKLTTSRISEFNFLKLQLKLILILISIASLVMMSMPSAFAIDYTVTYNANETQHQTGVTSGSVPNQLSQAANSVVTVSTNSGNLARQGFTFAGWNTLANGTGTTYAPGTGSFTLTGNVTLYAKWEIPASARLIGAGGSIINFSDPNTVTNGSYCTDSNVRGITSDGTYIYFRPNLHLAYICKVNLSGQVVSVSPSITALGNLAADSLALTYSRGCIFIRDTGLTGNTNIYCIDVSDWSITLRTLPNNFYAGSTWLYGNLIDFPDGRVGAVSGPGTTTVSPGTVTCPVGFSCKVLRLFKPIGSGKTVTFEFSEDIVLADTVSGWPDDEHGIATDGTYLYEIRHANGYKVWALRSGAPSYLVFNGDGTGTCGASTGVSGTKCTITNPTNGTASGGMTNATYIGRIHGSGIYLIGDYDGKRFYKSPAGFPPAGPGSLIASFNSLTLAGNATTASFRTPVVVTVNLNVESKVTFKAGNTVLSGCKNKTANGSGSSFSATCTWKPSVRGNTTINVVATPTGVGAFGSSTSTPLNIFVGKRSGTR